MRSVLPALVVSAAISTPAFGQEPALSSVSDLVKQASRKVTAVARTPLAAPTSDVLHVVTTLEPPASGRTPNYLRALAIIPGSVQPFATAFKTLVYGGTVEPETKIAMALQVARVLQSPYVAVHARRMLAASDRGRGLLSHLESGTTIRPDQDLALRYAAWLTSDVHGVDDERFRQVRGFYNDAQIVELTLTVSFFNYFTRIVEAVNLPVEPWALELSAVPPRIEHERQLARVNLISDGQLAWAQSLRARQQPAGEQNGDAFGLVNSQRAMNLVPDVSSAWRAYTGTTGADAVVSREVKLQVSFAVSMANGCRYCTLHQVLGLRRLGVSPGKLLEMQKNDSALTPRELTAVTFARKLTRAPASITDEDYNRLRSEFGERGALEVVLQTCNFAFMNRFTDNLGLPSEDEAVSVYREVYGRDWKK